MVNTLRARGFSLSVIASALEDLYGGREEFVSHLRRTLYRRTPLGDITLTRPTSKVLVDQVKKNNATLRAVGAMCARTLPSGVVPNPQVRCVVSFNLDTLLEAFTHARYGAPLLRPIHHAAISTTPTLTSVYHIHGYLPMSREPAERVVLTETDYFDVFAEPFGAFTYTFLYFLREFSCVFVGLSMRDDNLRRLLYYSVRERLASMEAAHFGGRRDARVKRHFAILRRDTNDTDFVIERGLARLGVQTIFLNDYDEIADHLGFVYEAGGDKWGDVF